MILFKKLKKQKEISLLLPHYENTFPANERRENDEFVALSKNSNVEILSILEDEDFIGYTVVWNLENFWYLEHFEILKKFRNRKFGTTVLNLLTEQYPKMVLESEPSGLDKIAERRIGFYQRNGFHIIDTNYIQPSYGGGKSSVELYLLANFSHDNLCEIVKKIHQQVYSFEENSSSRNHLNLTRP